MATKWGGAILDLLLVPIMSPVHGLNGLSLILDHAGLAGDQVHHKAGLAGEPVPNSVVKSSECASESGGLQDFGTAKAGSSSPGMFMLVASRWKQIITILEWKTSEPTPNKMLFQTPWLSECYSRRLAINLGHFWVCLKDMESFFEPFFQRRVVWVVGDNKCWHKPWLRCSSRYRDCLGWISSDL